MSFHDIKITDDLFLPTSLSWQRVSILWLKCILISIAYIEEEGTQASGTFIKEAQREQALQPKFCLNQTCQAPESWTQALPGLSSQEDQAATQASETDATNTTSTTSLPYYSVKQTREMVACKLISLLAQGWRHAFCLDFFSFTQFWSWHSQKTNGSDGWHHICGDLQPPPLNTTKLLGLWYQK